MGKVAYWLSLLVVLVVSTSSKRLVCLHDIFRHGARSPHSDTNAYSTPEGYQYLKDIGVTKFNELLPDGKRGHYYLGKVVYRKYWKQLFGGTPDQHRLNRAQVMVHSTYFSRAKTSLQSHLLGLFEDLQQEAVARNKIKVPFKGYDNSVLAQAKGLFPVYGQRNRRYHSLSFESPLAESYPSNSKYKQHATPYNYGDSFLGADIHKCPKQFKRWQKENFKSEYVQIIEEIPQVKKLFQEVSKEIGFEVSFRRNGLYLLSSQSFLKKMGLHTLNAMEDPQNAKTASFIEVTYSLISKWGNELQRRAKATLYLQKLLRDVDAAISGEGPKLILISGHDNTLVNLLINFQVLTLECLIRRFQGTATEDKNYCVTQSPPVVSSILVEVWQQNQEYTIKFLYNGQPLQLPICSMRVDCPLEQFRRWAQTRYVDVNQVCQIPDQ